MMQAKNFQPEQFFFMLRKQFAEIPFHHDKRFVIKMAICSETCKRIVPEIDVAFFWLESPLIIRGNKAVAPGGKLRKRFLMSEFISFKPKGQLC